MLQKSDPRTWDTHFLLSEIISLFGRTSIIRMCHDDCEISDFAVIIWVLGGGTWFEVFEESHKWNRCSSKWSLWTLDQSQIPFRLMGTVLDLNDRNSDEIHIPNDFYEPAFASSQLTVLKDQDHEFLCEGKRLSNNMNTVSDWLKKVLKYILCHHIPKVLASEMFIQNWRNISFQRSTVPFCGIKFN